MRAAAAREDLISGLVCRVAGAAVDREVLLHQDVGHLLESAVVEQVLVRAVVAGERQLVEVRAERTDGVREDAPSSMTVDGRYPRRIAAVCKDFGEFNERILGFAYDHIVRMLQALVRRQRRVDTPPDKRGGDAVPDPAGNLSAPGIVVGHQRHSDEIRFTEQREELVTHILGIEPARWRFLWFEPQGGEYGADTVPVTLQDR